MRAIGIFRFPRTPAVVRTCGFFVSLIAGALRDSADAGAWLLPPGEGQIISGAEFSGTTRAFDAQGRLVPVPYYQKFELGTYIEYGLLERLTLVAAPAYDRIRVPPPSQSYDYQGLGESAFGARFGLYRAESTVVSLEAAIRTPGASFANVVGPVDPHRTLSLDIRALIGRSVEIATMPAFIDVQGGYRLYAHHQPSEWHLDVTFGLRPVPRLLWLLQSFSTVSTSTGGGFVQQSWQKLAASVVLDLGKRWSIQCGGFMTIAGFNAGRERGPFAAVWYRF